MAASDPVTDVPTPTGTLQGVAAFSWDGSAWQPSGRAGPSVATPTGVLRGVAAFNGGPAWQPAGLAQPGVATPTGTLDGVAVYTWTGDSWAPPGGQPTPSTPSGALRGVAAFNWDGAAWQPAGQAGPSVATPYGVLDGVAMFGWSGSAWAAVGAPSLSLDFMTPGALDPRITFARASTATYFNSAGVMQTAAANAPRWDYNPATLTLNGLLIEEARTNVALWSGDISNAAWAAVNVTVTAPVVTGNQVVAPDGTVTAARLVLPAVSAGGTASIVQQGITATAAAYVFSVWMRGSVGGEQTYIYVYNGATYYRQRVTLTTSWQRFVVTTPSLTASSWWFVIGTDLRDAGQASTLAQTIFAWGGQFEAGAFPTSYIPCLAAAVTRAADIATMPATASWRNTTAESWQAEFISEGYTSSVNPAVLGDNGSGSAVVGFYGTTLQVYTFDGGSAYNTTNALTVGSVAKAASTFTGSTTTLCANKGPVAVGTPFTGFTGMTTLRLSSTGAANTSNGWLRRIRYWPRTLSNAELQSVTT